MELIALLRSIDFSDFFLFFFLMVEIGKWNSIDRAGPDIFEARGEVTK